MVAFGGLFDLMRLMVNSKFRNAADRPLLSVKKLMLTSIFSGISFVPFHAAAQELAAAAPPVSATPAIDPGPAAPASEVTKVVSLPGEAATGAPTPEGASPAAPTATEQSIAASTPEGTASAVATTEELANAPPLLPDAPASPSAPTADVPLTQADASSAPAAAVTPELDAQLGGLLERVLSSHPQVESARYTARAAGYDLKTARWQRFPSISVEALEALQQRNVGTLNRLYPTLNVEQPIWTGGRLSGIMKQARYARSSAVAFYEGTVLQVALDVVDAYYATLRSTRRLALFETSRDRHQAMVVTIERRVNAMVSPAADLELARTRLAQINQQVDLAKAQRDVALDRLRELLDDPEFTLVDERPKPATWPSFDGDSVLEEAKAYPPRLRQLRGEADVASADIQIARSAMMPQISGQYLYSDFQGARAGVVVRLQTGAGLSRFTAIDSARERKKSSDLRIAAEERSLRNQIFAQHAEFTSSLVRLPSSLDAAASAERVRQSYLRQFISGRRSWLDVMNSFQETTSADISVVDTETTALSAMDRLLLLTGRWRLEIKDPSQ